MRNRLILAGATFGNDGSLDLTNQANITIARTVLQESLEHERQVARAAYGLDQFVNHNLFIQWPTAGLLRNESFSDNLARARASVTAHEQALAALGRTTTAREQERLMAIHFGDNRGSSLDYGGHFAANQLIAGRKITLNNGTEYADAAAFVDAQPQLAAALRADFTRRARDHNNDTREDAAAALAALNNAEREARRRRAMAQNGTAPAPALTSSQQQSPLGELASHTNLTSPPAVSDEHLRASMQALGSAALGGLTAIIGEQNLTGLQQLVLNEATTRGTQPESLANGAVPASGASIPPETIRDRGGLS